jgi:hypothetical protein
MPDLFSKQRNDLLNQSSVKFLFFLLINLLLSRVRSRVQQGLHGILLGLPVGGERKNLLAGLPRKLIKGFSFVIG